jgi:holliday junction DNA helicase RuvB
MVDETDLASPYAERDERELEAALRPRTLDDFVGQPKVREQLGLVLTSALRRGRRRTTSCSPERPGSARPAWR